MTAAEPAPARVLQLSSDMPGMHVPRPGSTFHIRLPRRKVVRH